MNYKSLLGVMLAITSLSIAGCVEVEKAGSSQEKSDQAVIRSTDRPNFLVIVADDLGYSDLGIYGGEIDTPNIDQLARDGLMFTNFFVAGTCTPTRAMLLTGVDHHRAGLGNMTEHIAPNQIDQPGYEGYLNDRVVTVSERLNDAGYRTYVAGKWHVGKTPESYPSGRGFDKSFVLKPGGASHFDEAGLHKKVHPAPYLENGEKAGLPEEFKYSTDFYTERLIKYLESERGSEEPFFAYLPYTAPHWPLQAWPKDIAKYEGAYDAGWEVVRQSRLKRMIELGLVPSGTAVAGIQTDFPAWEDLSEEERRFEARRMEIFAAMVDRVDQKVGELISYLKETDQFENTVIVFMSDNGSEGFPLQELPIFANWIPRFDNSYENLGAENSYMFLEERWAQVSNTPNKLFKGMPTDGGIRVPAFVTYRGFKNQSARYDGLVHVMDITPTLLSLAGLETNITEYEGRNVYPVEGKSMLAALNATGPIRTENEGLGWELFNKRAYRKGDWKVVHMHPPWGHEGWHLYNVANDPGETTDVSEKHPEIFKNLIADWENYADTNGVILGNIPPDR